MSVKSWKCSINIFHNYYGCTFKYLLSVFVHSRARHRKGLLPTPKRSPLTSSSPSQRISAAAATAIPVAPPITTPPINPALSYPLPPSTVAGYAPAGSQAHTYTTNFTAAAPVQNTVIVQQPGQSVYVQQQVCTGLLYSAVYCKVTFLWARQSYANSSKRAFQWIYLIFIYAF